MKARLSAAVSKARSCHTAKKGVHAVGIVAHLGYCSAVFAEGHGVYAVCGAVLGIAIAVETFFGEA